MRVVSRGGKCAVLLEHTDKDGLFASCPITSPQTVEPALDSSRYFVLRLADGKGRTAFVGVGFNDRTQAFDFKVSLQDWENHNTEGGTPGGLEAATAALGKTLAIPQGGTIHVPLNNGGGDKKKNSSNSNVSSAFGGMKLDAPPKGGEESEKEKKKRKKREKAEKAEAASSSSSSSSAAASSSSSSAFDSLGSSSSTTSSSAPVVDLFGFGDFSSFDPLSTPSKSMIGNGVRRASIADPFASDATTSTFGGKESTPFE